MLLKVAYFICFNFTFSKKEESNDSLFMNNH